MEEYSKSIEVIRTLKQVMGVVKQMIHCKYKDMNLTGPQGMLLSTLAHCGGNMKVSDLSDKLELSNSTVSGILDRLEKQGLVERTRSDVDRRVVYINITPEYKKISDVRFKEIEAFFEAKMSKASEEEADKIVEGLNILKKLLD